MEHAAVDESFFDNLDDLNVVGDAPVTSGLQNDEWLDLMRSELEESVVKQVLKTDQAKTMRRCDSVPAHLQFFEKNKPRAISKVSSMASLGSQKNLASMCSEVTITPVSSVPDLLEYERRHAAGDKSEVGLGLERMKLSAAGTYSPGMWSREEALMRYRRKKNNRCFRKKIRYECRRRIASDRPRVGGRFARTEDEINEFDELEQFVNIEEIPSEVPSL